MTGFNNMSLRDWFAGQAMIGLASDPHIRADWSDETLGHRAYALAAAMIAARPAEAQEQPPTGGEGDGAAEADGWRPIKTAPKNGTALLLTPGPCEVSSFINAVKVGGWDEQRECWHIFGGSWMPTHWQPLPAPPAHVPQPTPDPDGWIPVEGGMRPVGLADGALVHVRLRNYRDPLRGAPPSRVSFLTWGECGHGTIVAYRLATPEALS